MRVRQGLRLDQQTASFVAVTAPAEANDNSVSGAFRLHTLSEQRIARRQVLEIIETNTAQARRAPIFHHQEIAGAAAPVALPVRVQWLDHHQIGARLAFFAKRSRFFSESFRETQWVRYSPSIVGSPLRLKRSVWRRGVRVT